MTMHATDLEEVENLIKKKDKWAIEIIGLSINSPNSKKVPMTKKKKSEPTDVAQC
jgi:hypothetical protein